MTHGTTLIISDVHTHFQVINEQVFHAEKTTGQAVGQVFVLGDFGFFQDKLREYFRHGGNSFTRPVACIEGNHEDHGAVPDLAYSYADVFTYVSRGKIHSMDPWRGLCIGGASYMDAAITPRGSEITEDDIAHCLSHDPQVVDLVLSHDCPAGIGVPGTPGMEHYGLPGEARLSLLARRYQPRWWFFGHHHRWFDLQQDGTRYIGLPESWVGYVLLHADGQVRVVPHLVDKKPRPWWKQWPGFK